MLLKLQSMRAVRCYHCGRGFEAAAKAMLLTCPHCYKPVRMNDVVVKGAHHTKSVETCGRILVERKGWLMASHVHAVGGIEVHGTLDARTVVSGPVYLHSKSRFRGDLTAPTIYLETGASVDGGYFVIGPPIPEDAA